MDPLLEVKHRTINTCERDEFLHKTKTYDIEKTLFGTHKKCIYRLYFHSQNTISFTGLSPQ